MSLKGVKLYFYYLLLKYLKAPNGIRASLSWALYKYTARNGMCHTDLTISVDKSDKGWDITIPFYGAGTEKLIYLGVTGSIPHFILLQQMVKCSVTLKSDCKQVVACCFLNLEQICSIFK